MHSRTSLFLTLICLGFSLGAVAQKSVPRNELAHRWNYTAFFSYFKAPSASNLLPMGMSYTRYNKNGHGWMVDAGYQKQVFSADEQYRRPMTHPNLQQRSFWEAGVKRIHTCWSGNHIDIGGFYGLGYRRMKEDYTKGGYSIFQERTIANQVGVQAGVKLTYNLCEHLNVSLMEEAGYFRTVQMQQYGREATPRTGLSGKFSLTTRIAVGMRF